MSVSLPKAVFFDWDGTLVDSFAFLHKTHNHVRGILGKPVFSIEEFGTYFGQPREKLYKELYGEENIEIAKGHFESYVIANHHEIQAIEGAEEVLQELSRLGVPMGVVTNKKGDLVRKEIINHGWQDYFISVVGAGEAEHDKPSSAPLFLALEQSGLGVAPEDIWFVGDTESDLACAFGAGAPCVYIECPIKNEALIEKYKPLLIFNDCKGFGDFLLQSNLNPLQKVTGTNL